MSTPIGAIAMPARRAGGSHLCGAGQVVADNPFPDEPNPRWVHAIFRNGPLAPDELAAVAAAQQRAQDQGSDDEARVVGTTLFLHTPGGLGRSELATQLTRLGGSRTAETAGTARNWATVNKLLTRCDGEMKAYCPEGRHHIFATGLAELVPALQDRDRVDGRARSAADPQRRRHEQELPASAGLTCQAQVLQLQVVQEMDAHRVDREDVDREGDPLGCARRGVAVAVGPERGDAAFGHEWHGRRMQPRLGADGIPRTELGEASGVTGADQEDIALADGDALGPLGGFELVAEDVLAGLQPGHPSEPGNIQQHATADQPVTEGLDGTDCGSLRGDPLAWLAVVERPTEANVAQRVEVGVGVAVVVEADIVHGKAQRPQAGVVIGEPRDLVGGRARVVGGSNRGHREAHADGDAVPDQSGGRDDAGGGQVVQRTSLVGLAPASPSGNGREERGEVVGADIHLGVLSAASYLLRYARPIGPINAVQLLISWSHPGRLRSEAAFTMLAGAAPVQASSGQVVRHRLNRGGDRALHTIVMLRQVHHGPTRAYTSRRIAQGKSQREIRRCLKRTVARQPHRLLERTATNQASS